MNKRTKEQKNKRTKEQKSCSSVSQFFSSSVNVKRGFTLIETIIALAIFSASIVGLISVTSSGVANTNFAKNKLTASYLAQEGIELVRNMRDTGIIDETGWSDIFSTGGSLGPCTSPNGMSNCHIDAINDPLKAVFCEGACPPLYYSTSGFYNYGSGDLSIFTRIITVEEVNIGVEVRVTSIIRWQQGRTDKFVTMTASLFNWIQI